MSEWGKYLKNAVANVEQQLDKVLAENNGSSLSSQLPKLSALKSESRPKTQEQATSNRLTEENTDPSTQSLNPEVCSTGGESVETALVDKGNSNPEINITANASHASISQLTVSQIVDPPDFGSVLKHAKELALAVKLDDSLALVDELEALHNSYGEYVEYMTRRLTSTNMKLGLTSAKLSENEYGDKKTIALLIEESQKLSQQELKLGLLVKRLRADKQSLLNQLKHKDDIQETVKEQKEEILLLKSKLRDLEALNEHYRLQLDFSTNSKSSNNSSEFTKLQKEYAQDKVKWHSIEMNLLSRITELEQASDLRHSLINKLQQSLSEAQHQVRISRDQVVSLQDELDQLKESHKLKTSTLAKKVEDLENTLQTKQLTIEHYKNKSSSYSKMVPKTTEITEKELKYTGTGEMQGRSETEISLSQKSIDSVRATSLCSPIEHDLDGHSSLSNDGIDFEPLLGPTDVNIDSQTVGPSGPFGVNTFIEQTLDNDNSFKYRGSFSHGNSFDHEGQYTPSRPSRASSQSIDDSFSFFANHNFKRESSADSFNTLSNTHLVQKLTVSVRKLKHELIIAQKDAKIANQQRQEMQKEIVQYVNNAELLASKTQETEKLHETKVALEKEIAYLKESVADKSEKIEELEADVRDLKEMYKEQIETLVSEIEKMKK